MSKAWIEEIAENIKRKDRDAANAYGREQHRAGIVAAKGHGFFASLTLFLEDDFAELKSKLQGDVTASETTVETKGQDQLVMMRSRFPWFDAVLKYERASLLLDFAQGRGVPAAGKLADRSDRKIIIFPFVVGPDDALSIEEGFEDQPRRYAKPEELAQRIVEILFAI